MMYEFYLFKYIQTNFHDLKRCQMCFSSLRKTYCFVAVPSLFQTNHDQLVSVNLFEFHASIDWCYLQRFDSLSMLPTPNLFIRKPLHVSINIQPMHHHLLRLTFLQFTPVLKMKTCVSKKIFTVETLLHIIPIKTIINIWKKIKLQGKCRLQWWFE